MLDLLSRNTSGNDTMSEPTVYILFYLGMRKYYGKVMNREWRILKKAWRKSNNQPDHCFKCGRLVKRQHRKATETATIDHIIPKNVIFQLEIPELLFDLNNFQQLCQPCNNKKANRMPRESELSPELLASLHEALDNKGLYQS